MIRRFVNLVAANNHDRCVYSLHRLDVGKHLFYPSTTEAEAANAKEEDSHNGGGGGDNKSRRPSKIESLRRLPEPIVRFQQFPPDDDDDVVVEGHRIHLWSPSNERYDAGDDSAGSITTLPSFDGPSGFRPIAVPISTPRARPPPTIVATGKHLYMMTSQYDCGCGHSHSFQVLDISQHPRKWEPLPPPPFAHGESVNSITSFTVVDGGSNICVSTRQERTYCFDTSSHKWWHAGDWMLPFIGPAEYVPELDAWLGLRFSWYWMCAEYGHLCASSDLRAAVHYHREPTLQHVWEDLSPPPAEQESIRLSRRFNEIVIKRRKEWKPSRSPGDLINLGGGRFCVAKFFQVEQVVSLGFEEDTQTEEEFVVLTGVEVLRDGEGELRMVRHRSKRYMFTTDVIQWVL